MNKYSAELIALLTQKYSAQPIRVLLADLLRVAFIGVNEDNRLELQHILDYEDVFSLLPFIIKYVPNAQYQLVNLA